MRLGWLVAWSLFVGALCVCVVVVCLLVVVGVGLIAWSLFVGALCACDCCLLMRRVCGSCYYLRDVLQCTCADKLLESADS